MGKQINFLSLLFLVIVLTSFVSAIPPVLQDSNFAGGYEIKVPFIGTLKQNQDFTFNFHLFNISNGYPIDNSSTNCYFDLYNSSGVHLVEVIIPHENSIKVNEWELKVLGGNFSAIGQYGYIVQCNSSASSLGGVEEVGFEVTYTGNKIDTGQSILYIPLFAMIIFTFIMILFFINKLPSANTRDEEGKILSVTYLKYLRSPLWFFEYMLFVAILYLSSNLAFAYLYETLFAQILFVLFRISFGLAPVIVIVWIIWIYAKMFQDKQFQDMINRGIFPQGKL